MSSPTTQLPLNGNDRSWNTFPNVSESGNDSSSLSHLSLHKTDGSHAFNATISWTNVDGAWNQFVEECASSKTSFLIDAAREDDAQSCNLHFNVPHGNTGTVS